MNENILIRLLSDPIAIIWVVLFFGASIFIHELGHFLAARWRGLKIERFSIGFGPKLLGWKDKQGVDWRISLFPLGGYVALPQLADLRGIEGDSEIAEDALPPISYTDKMIVAVAGAVFNVLFALCIGTIIWKVGIPVQSAQQTTTIGYVMESMSDANTSEREGPALRAGIQPGDKILKIDGSAIDDWEDVMYGITTGVGRSENNNPQTQFLLERNGEQIEKTVFPILDSEEGIRRIGIGPASPLIVGRVMEDSPAKISGLQEGDEIVAANSTPIFHRAALSELIEKNPNASIELEVLRNGERVVVSVLPEEVPYNKAGDTIPMIGVQWDLVSTTSIIHPSPLSQITNALDVTIKVLVALFHPKSDIGINNLSGPVGISYTLYVISQIGLIDVLSIVVLININLAILNLLPIPVLDGGHMAFATIGKLRGKPLPHNFIASAQGLFMILFLTIFVYVTFFDVGRVHRNESAIIEQERAAREQIPIEFSGESIPEMETVEETSEK